jgi:hypothetical protein
MATKKPCDLGQGQFLSTYVCTVHMHPGMRAGIFVPLFSIDICVGFKISSVHNLCSFQFVSAIYIIVNWTLENRSKVIIIIIRHVLLNQYIMCT